ncbi:hypothetical protein [Halobacillus ihumii]|uniref:hypothetical protein n=1 Tax=Halobacillus ihumii TaxID=2686092 RepID=UPI0013D39584|nr:hypothetical protein [Halobacillus ihumii]
MEDLVFKEFYEQFKIRASQHDLSYLKRVTSKNLIAREVREGEVTDYSYQESIAGWKQAFDHFADMEMEWKYTDHSLTKLKEDEWLASFYLSPIIEGEEAAPHLYFNIFKLMNNQWQLVRSYIETGVANPTIPK